MTRGLEGRILRPPNIKIYKYGRRIKNMVYTEIKEKNGRKYYYRVKSIKLNNKVSKERIYLGVNLTKEKLRKMEKEADRRLNIFDTILTKDEEIF